MFGRMMIEPVVQLSPSFDLETVVTYGMAVSQQPSWELRLQATNSAAESTRKCKQPRRAHELPHKTAIISPAYTRLARCRRGRSPSSERRRAS